jgi:hypothetical protein
MLSLKVPATADIFQPVTLICEYDLESRNLYSVKWYKDECEFFRYMPDYEPQSQAFPTPGITLDVSKPVAVQVSVSSSEHFTVLCRVRFLIHLPPLDIMPACCKSYYNNIIYNDLRDDCNE